MEYKTYTIKAVSELTGLTELVIRAWENRHNAVVPDRQNGNRRVYSEQDVEKLLLLKRLTDSKYRIGNIAKFSVEELKDILTLNDIKKSESEKSVQTGSENVYYNIVSECIFAIRNFDGKKLETLLTNSSVEFSRVDFIDNIIIPLMSKVGEYWMDGVLRVAHEHFASTTVRKIIAGLLDGYKIDDNAPKMILATPQGQYHEIGALIAGVIASGDGWKVTYLGPSLPTEEIVYTADKINADVIFLSIIYPSDDPQLGYELQKLENMIPESKLIFSGSSIGGYKKVVENLGGNVVENSDQLRKKLSDFRDGN